MAIVTRRVDYLDHDTRLRGRVYFDDSSHGPRPGVLVSHAWGGRDDFANQQAENMAKLGYVGFALDIYGAGIRGNGVEECQKLMTPFVEDRALLARRITAALTTLRSLPEVDATRIAAFGFCFGGLCVLDLARSGADVRGVVSFHGLLKGHDLPKQTISAKVLVLHGDADPLAPFEDVIAFRNEMNAAGGDWQLHAYGKILHAFAVPGASMPGVAAHDAVAEARSQTALRNFLSEVLA
ncbi:MAG: dienelactone hydrolase family protein [Nevskia sp.]|uniref:dienelactone hydrolase family protein n=1 Tax=Nevskia sp. TaxID=1929292 RepID=UPI00403653A1